MPSLPDLRRRDEHGRLTAGRSALAALGFPLRRSLERRAVILAAAAAAFVAVFVLRQTSTDAADAVELLYAVPIALIALELGLIAGMAAGLFAIALLSAWLTTAHVDIDFLGVVSRSVAFLAVGGLGGRFSDRMRDAQARHRFLLQSGLALAQHEVDDELGSILANLARKVTLPASVRVTLGGDPAVQVGSPAKSRWEETLPVQLRGVQYGTLDVGTPSPLAAEDRATLAILALQAAVAAENRELLERERERAVIRAQLELAQTDLAERSGQLRELMVRQEAERYQVSRELHDDAAQVLAAVLLGLKALERQLGSGPRPEKWQVLRGDIDATLQSLRSLAISLRPPVLRLGLEAALEDLGEHAAEHGVGRYEVRLSEADVIDPELETMVFRVVEEALESVGPADRLAVIGHDGRELVIEAEGTEAGGAPERLRILRARTEMAGGALTATPSSVRAVIPLGARLYAAPHAA